MAVDELIERLKAADKPDRWIDSAIWRRRNPEYSLIYNGERTTVAKLTGWTDGKIGAWFGPPAYTGSTDAALHLAMQMHGEDRALMILAEIVEGFDHNSDLSIADLPRLVCLAALSNPPKGGGVE